MPVLKRQTQGALSRALSFALALSISAVTEDPSVDVYAALGAKGKPSCAFYQDVNDGEVRMAIQYCIEYLGDRVYTSEWGLGNRNQETPFFKITIKEQVRKDGKFEDKPGGYQSSAKYASAIRFYERSGSKVNVLSLSRSSGSPEKDSQLIRYDGSVALPQKMLLEHFSNRTFYRSTMVGENEDTIYSDEVIAAGCKSEKDLAPMAEKIINQLAPIVGRFDQVLAGPVINNESSNNSGAGNTDTKKEPAKDNSKDNTGKTDTQGSAPPVTDNTSGQTPQPNPSSANTGNSAPNLGNSAIYKNVVDKHLQEVLQGKHGFNRASLDSTVDNLSKCIGENSRGRRQVLRKCGPGEETFGAYLKTLFAEDNLRGTPVSEVGFWLAATESLREPRTTTRFDDDLSGNFHGVFQMGIREARFHMSRLKVNDRAAYDKILKTVHIDSNLSYNDYLEILYTPEAAALLAKSYLVESFRDFYDGIGAKLSKEDYLRPEAWLPIFVGYKLGPGYVYSDPKSKRPNFAAEIRKRNLKNPTLDQVLDVVLKTGPSIGSASKKGGNAFSVYALNIASAYQYGAAKVAARQTQLAKNP